MEIFVYVIKSDKTKRFYFGQTNNLSNRLKKHNKGGSIYTKHFRPWGLFSYKKVNSRTDAMLLERKLKNLKSRTKVLDFLKKNKFSFTKKKDSLDDL